MVQRPSRPARNSKCSRLFASTETSPVSTIGTPWRSLSRASCFVKQKVRPETFAAAVDLFGAQGTVEIAALIGDYLMVTTLYNALGMRLRPDQTPTLPHRAGAPVGAEWR